VDPERLARAGLLATTGALRVRPDPAALAEARAAAGALAADMISDDRG